MLGLRKPSVGAPAARTQLGLAHLCSRSTGHWASYKPHDLPRAPPVLTHPELTWVASHPWVSSSISPGTLVQHLASQSPLSTYGHSEPTSDSVSTTWFPCLLLLPSGPHTTPRATCPTKLPDQQHPSLRAVVLLCLVRARMGRSELSGNSAWQPGSLCAPSLAPWPWQTSQPLAASCFV